MEFMVNKQTGERIPTAGITLYADLPVGSWVKNDMGTIPYGFLKEGDPISQSEYPDLYAKYGSTVPYMADTSELSDYAISITFEQITAGYTMPYDGVLSLGANSTAGSTIAYLTINGERVINLGVSSYTGATVNFRKGDVVRAYDITTNNYILKVAYYTKSLIVKAKNVGVPADIIEGVKNSADTTPTLNSTNLITSGGVYDTFAYRQSSAVVCVFRRMKSDGSVEETGTTHQCLVLPLLGAEKIALIIGDGEVNVNATDNQQKFSFALSGIAANGIVNDGCLNIAIEGQSSPYLGYVGGFGDFWVNGIPTGLSNTKCRARFMCVCKLQ